MGVGAGFCMYDVVINKLTFAISSPDEFLFYIATVTVTDLVSVVIVMIWKFCEK